MGVAIAAYRMYIVITRVYSSNIITYFHFLHIDFKFSFAAVMFPLLNFFGCSDPLPTPGGGLSFAATNRNKIGSNIFRLLHNHFWVQRLAFRMRADFQLFFSAVLIP